MAHELGEELRSDLHLLDKIVADTVRARSGDGALAAIRRNLVATLRPCRDGSHTLLEQVPAGPSRRPRAARPDGKRSPR
jgi:hypothetical protein